MSGRKDLFDQNVHDSKFEEKLKVLAEKVETGKLSLSEVAKLYGKHPRTMKRTFAKLKTKQLEVATDSPVENFNDVPELDDFTVYLKSKTKDWKTKLSYIKRIWIEVWENKPLRSLTQQDFSKAVVWLKEQKRSTYGDLMSLRYLVRFGFGRHEFLTSLLETRGFKDDPRMPPELLDEQTFKTVLPRLLNRLRLMIQQGQISPDDGELVELVLLIKVSTGIRTGDRNEERELWGTRIGTEGKTKLVLDGDGKILVWKVNAKMGEQWTISRATFAAAVRAKLEAYIRRKGLRNGDWLLPGGDHLQRVLKGLSDACKLEGFSHLILHDMRKIYATAAVHADVKMETLAGMNVGWRDLNTLNKHYVMIKGLRAESEALKLAKFLKLDEGENVISPSEDVVETLTMRDGPAALPGK